MKTVYPLQTKFAGGITMQLVLEVTDNLLHILLYFNQKLTENTAKTLKYHCSYTDSLQTKWCQR